MKCYVCSSETRPFFTKNFEGLYRLKFVEYWKCLNCGFVLSKTHRDMSQGEWEELNEAVHSSFQGTDSAKDDPKWLSRLTKQANVIGRLTELGVIPVDVPWVDYACGDGQLACMLKDKFAIEVDKYDRYMSSCDSGYITHSQMIAKEYGNLISTSAIEHFLSIDSVEEMMSILSDSGVFVVHTLVRENIPCDPQWFYLLPAHVALHTNRSMAILFERYGFEASVYHPESTMWFWFRNSTDFVEKVIREQNELIPGQFFFRNGFMDYWKQ